MPGLDIAVVAPGPVPLQVGGAERLWWGLVGYLNEHTEHKADLIKLPVPERDFGEVVDAYERFSNLDVSGYDVVVTGKYPAWMVDHPDQRVYMLHPLRGLYDQYPGDWPVEVSDAGRDVRDLLGFMDAHPCERTSLDELFARLRALRIDAAHDAGLLGLPGPLLRRVVRFLDGVGLAPGAVRRYATMSNVVRDRAGYFPDGVEVRVAHPASGLATAPPAGQHHLLCVSRLDRPKRIDLVIEAYRVSGVKLPLVIAGAGPDEPRLRGVAMGLDGVRFLGRVSDAALTELYAGALAVVFAPLQEDFGYVALEAMRAAKPVITTSDSGGVAELVTDGIDGRVCAPRADALAAAIADVARRRRGARRLGAAARRRADAVGWQQVVDALLGP